MKQLGKRLFSYATLFLAAVLLLAGSSALADVTGSVLGLVTDSSGAALPKARITIVNAATNQSLETVSDNAGEYRFLALPAGNYNLRASADGFSAFATQGIDVTVNSRVQINVTLTVGRAEQTVDVQADTLQVETASTQVGGVIESKQMLAMPLNGRSFLDLLGLQAGVAPATSGTIPNDRPVSGLTSNPGNVSIGGQPESANQFLVNGGDVNETKNMGAGLIPNLDSIAEFRLITNSFDAEYGKSTGAIMNAITKSGSNSIHGTVFEFLRNDALDATNFFDQSKAELRQNQFGYAVGGPILKNKLFWFTDYQGTRITHGASTGNVNLPTAAQRMGAFDPSDFTSTPGTPGGTPFTVNGAGWAGVLSARLGYQVTDAEAYSTPTCISVTQCVFPGGQIPQTAFDKVAVNINKLIPLPNLNATTYSSNSQKGSVRDDKAGQRVDFDSKRLGTLSFYYHFDDATIFNPLPQASFPGFGSMEPSRAQMITASDIKPIGSTSVNEFRLSFFRTSLHSAIPDGGTADLASLGFTVGAGTDGIVPSGPAGYPAVIPAFRFNSFTLGDEWLNNYQVNNTYQVADSFSKIIGEHSLKFGGDYRYYQIIERNVAAPNGDFTFSGTETGNDFADYLLGATALYQQATLQIQDGRNRYGGLFGQDSWRAKKNLVVNAGLRWDVVTPWYDTQGKTESLNPGAQSVIFPTAPPGLLVPGDPGVPQTVSPIRWHNFQPRLGIAYSPDFSDGILHKVFGDSGKSSIRAAYGIFFLGPADLGNFGIVGDAPYGLYWASLAPVLTDTPFVTRSTNTSQGQRFPYNIPTPGDPSNKTLNWAQFYPLNEPGYGKNNHVPYTTQYQLSLQRELARGTVMTLAYVGTQSHRLERSDQLNPGDGALCNQLKAEGATPTCGPFSEANVYTLPNGQKIYGTYVGMGNQQIGQTTTGVVTWSQVQSLNNLGNSAYNSMQITLEHKTNSLNLLAAYTLSKSFDNVNTPYVAQYRSLSRSLSPFDVRNNFVISGNWEIPFDRAFGSAPHRLTQGWSLTGISHWSSGFPVTLSESDDQSLTGNIGIDRPNQVSRVVKGNPRNRNPDGSFSYVYFNAAAFQPEALGTVGNSSSRFFAGPGIVSTDITFGKLTPLRESVSALLRVDFFNVFNHANFNNPVGNISSGQFGQVTSARDPRIGQVGAKIVF